jgi:hypothetical protein
VIPYFDPPANFFSPNTEGASPIVYADPRLTRGPNFPLGGYTTTTSTTGIIYIRVYPHDGFHVYARVKPQRSRPPSPVLRARGPVWRDVPLRVPSRVIQPPGFAQPRRWRSKGASGRRRSQKHASKLTY